MPEYNAGSTVLLKHCTNWDSVISTGRSFTWALFCSQCVPTTVLRSRSGDKQWFDSSCGRAYDGKHTDYPAWYTARNANQWGQFVRARAEAKSIMHGAARE